MPSSNLPPEEQPSIKPFDPLVLDRTVIAVPLLKEMNDDLDLMKKVEEKHPDVFQEFNSVIEFDSDLRGGVRDAQKRRLVVKSCMRRMRTPNVICQADYDENTTQKYSKP